MSLFRIKGVHVKLDKPTHAGFKTRLLHHDLTMQAAFEEFARLVAAGNSAAVAILERMAMAKIKAELAEVGLTRAGTRKRIRPLDDLDHESLYDLINEAPDVKEDVPSTKGNHSETDR